eukprot:4615012-Amphidinium_carterae.1
MRDQAVDRNSKQYRTHATGWTTRRYASVGGFEDQGCQEHQSRCLYLVYHPRCVRAVVGTVSAPTNLQEES